MANTTNLDLVKPAGTDHALISVLNSNFDKIDTFAGQTKDDIETLEEGLAYIVGDTNTTGNTLAVGQFVYVKGHSTIAEGLRKVTSSISANGSITASNTDACSEGGLNALKGNIDLKANGRSLVADASTGNFIVTKTGRYVPVLFYGIHDNVAFCVLSISDTNFIDIVGNKSSYFSGSGTKITIASGTGGHSIYAVGSLI